MDGIIKVILGLVITFSLVAGLLPTFISAGNSINSSSNGSSIGALFHSSNGLLTLILLGGLLVATYYALSSMYKGKHR